MSSKLIIQMCIKFLIGLFIVSLLLFLPAGSIYYWNAWIFMGVLFIPMFAIGIILLIKSPELLAKRLNTKEEDKRDFTLIDALKQGLSTVNVPILYDADIGHIPPQMQIVNGAIGKVDFSDGKASVWQSFLK